MGVLKPAASAIHTQAVSVLLNRIFEAHRWEVEVPTFIRI